MCLSAVLGVAGGLLQAGSASKAAKAQEAAAREDIAFQTETRDLIRKDFTPYRGAGTNALAVYNHLLGLGPAPTFGGTAPSIRTVGGMPMPGQQPARAPVMGGGITSRERDIGMGQNAFAPQTSPQRFLVGDQSFNTMEDAQAYANANRTGGTAYGGIETTPGYQFQFDQGTAGVNALAGARGGLNSGATMQALTEFGQGLGAQYRDSYLNRLAGLVDGGMSAASMSGNASTNAAAGVSNALSGIGNAKAAGAIGVGNAFSDMGNNLIGLYQYQKAQRTPTTALYGGGR